VKAVQLHSRSTAVIAVLGAIALVAGWVVQGMPGTELLPSQLQQWRTVGSYFDHPPAWPGQAWMWNDRRVSIEELSTTAGPAHCHLESITLMTLGWPLGTVAHNASHARQYIRDTSRSPLLTTLLGTWARDPTPRPDAKDTGYRYGLIKLYFAPSDDEQYVYLLAPADSERWPRSDPMTLCS